jgi:hypothetical protein
VEGFVDVHSHAVPSGDDGARSIEEAVELCGLARAGGTRVLFATPHAHAAWDRYPLTLERERLFEEALPVVLRVVSAWGLGSAARLRGLPDGGRARPRDRPPGGRPPRARASCRLPSRATTRGTRAEQRAFPRAGTRAGHGHGARPERSLGLRADFGIARSKTAPIPSRMSQSDWRRGHGVSSFETPLT